MAGTETFVEYDILQQDAERGIHYSLFVDFWEKRMEPMQFIPREATGVLKVMRDKLQERAADQFYLFCRHQIGKLPQGAISAHSDGCGGSPQAGQLSDFTSPFASETLHD